MQSKWNKIYERENKNPLILDDYILRYYNYIKNVNTKILDLGCGRGNNAKVLIEKKKEIICADFSKEALNFVKENICENVVQMNMLNKFPFENNTFGAIICDLSLHYFSEKETFKVLSELKRILKKDGIIIFRVNSVRDVNYGADSKIEIEKNYYYAMEMNKRFFSIADVKYFFKDFKLLSVKENVMNRYGKEKHVIEGVVKNIK